MKAILITTITVFMLSGCIRHQHGFNLYFFTSNSTPGSYLFIDNKLQGELPYLKKRPRCEDDPLKQKALLVPIESGEYEVEVRDSHGNLLFAKELKIKHSFGSTSVASSIKNSKWNTKVTTNGICVVDELKY
jgi:hypothetical protein